MLVEQRGGVARIRRLTATTTVQSFQPPTLPTKFLQLSNEGANAVRIYFTAADAAANVNYLTLGASGGGTSYFEGPVELGDSEDKLWYLAEASTSALVMISYQRRG